MASGLRVVLIGCSVTGKHGSSTLFIGGKPVLPESWAKRTGSGSRLGYPALEVAVLQSGPPPVGAEVRERRRRVRGLSVAMVAAQGFPEVLMCTEGRYWAPYMQKGRSGQAGRPRVLEPWVAWPGGTAAKGMQQQKRPGCGGGPAGRPWRWDLTAQPPRGRRGGKARGAASPEGSCLGEGGRQG